MQTATKDDTAREMKHQSGYRDGASLSDNISDIANNAGRKVRSFFNSTYDEFAHTKDNVTMQIRTRPIQASLIALGLGVVLGALMRRR